MEDGPARPALPEEYLEGIRLFNAGEYYDAHEAWEERWQQLGGSAANFYKALIQFAVAALHWERGNHVGARKLFRSASRYLEPYAPRFLDLDVGRFMADMKTSFEPLFEAVEALQPVPPPDPARRPQIRLEPPGTAGQPEE